MPFPPFRMSTILQDIYWISHISTSKIGPSCAHIRFLVFQYRIVQRQENTHCLCRFNLDKSDTVSRMRVWQLDDCNHGDLLTKLLSPEDLETCCYVIAVDLSKPLEVRKPFYSHILCRGSHFLLESFSFSFFFTRNALYASILSILSFFFFFFQGFVKIRAMVDGGQRCQQQADTPNVRFGPGGPEI